MPFPRQAVLAVAMAAFAVPVALPSLATTTAASSGPRPPAPAVVTDSIAYASQIANGNAVATTITNFGFVGNNFTQLMPSLEYPLGSGYEHLPRAGLWFGAVSVSDSGLFTGVTTASLDIAQGNLSPTVSEFTPAGTAIGLRSTLPLSPYFDPAAVSELDLVSEYSDRPARRADGSPEDHKPLGVLVRQENYSWSFSRYGDILFFHYSITSTGPPMVGAWVGVYSEFASGDRSAHTCWPPSSVCSTVGSWYGKKWIAYDDSLRLFREHYCAAQPVPGGCLEARAPEWIGLELLGVRPGDLADTLDKRVTFAAWPYQPLSPYRSFDNQRYALMSAGTIQSISGDSLMPGTGDPVELLAVGPFPQLGLGDSVSVDFAIVGGADVQSIQDRARLAQAAYDAGFVDVTSATRIALASADADADRVRLVWSGGDGSLPAVTVYRREPETEWRAIGVATEDGTHLLRFEDRAVTPGARLGYRLGVGVAGSEEFFGEAWVEVPRSAHFALHGVRPQPAAAGTQVVSFALENGEPARLELFDLAGRRLQSRDLGSPGPGEHVVRLETGDGLAPGVYLVRLTQGTRMASARSVVVR